MAIKLADLLENVNTSHPLLDASISATTGGSIKGFGIFRNIAARSAVPADKRCFGYMAIVLYADGTNNEVSGFDSTMDFATAGSADLEYDLNQDGTFSASDSLRLLGIAGTTIATSEDVYGFSTSARVFIFKSAPFGINASSSGAASVLSSAGGATPNVSLTDENLSAAIDTPAWENADNWIEVTLGARGYNPIGSEAFANSASNYRLPLYDKTNKLHRSLEVDSLMAWITQTLIEAIISAGYGSTTLYTNPTTGVLGDFNGDGLVGTADLLIFLGTFGDSLGSVDTPQLVDTSVNNTTGALTNLQNALEAVQLALGNSAWQEPPSNTDFEQGSTEYQTPIFYSNGATTAVAGAFDVTLTIGNSAANRSTVTFSEGTGANDADWDVALPKLRLTGFALVGWGRLLSSVPSAVGFVWRIIFKNSSNSTILTKYRRFEKDISSPLPVGSTSDAVTLLDGVLNPTGQDGPDQVVLIDFTLTDNSVQGPGIPSNISTSDIATVTLELDYYVPNGDSAIYYQVTPSFTLILDEG
tara:strand:- start:486 stop:2072 length:1587 start_codon:yes stop_codon:yes gene_type:complete